MAKKLRHFAHHDQLYTVFTLVMYDALPGNANCLQDLAGDEGSHAERTQLYFGTSSPYKQSRNEGMVLILNRFEYRHRNILKPFGEGLKCFLEEKVVTSPLWLGILAGETDQRPTAAEWMTFVSSLLWIRGFHLISNVERPILSFSPSRHYFSRSELSRRGQEILSPLFDSWTTVIKDAYKTWHRDHDKNRSERLPLSPSSTSNPIAITILTHSDQLLSRTTLQKVLWNIDTAAANITLLSNRMTEYPEEFSTFQKNINAIYNTDARLDSLSKVYKRTAWQFPFQIATAVSVIVLLRPLSLPKVDMDRSHLLRLAYSLGPQSKRPRLLQLVEKILWTKLIGVACGKLTSDELLQEFFTELQAEDAEFGLSTVVSTDDDQFFSLGTLNFRISAILIIHSRIFNIPNLVISPPPPKIPGGEGDFALSVNPTSDDPFLVGVMDDNEDSTGTNSHGMVGITTGKDIVDSVMSS
ncbi:hypothetical protein EV368DRAFT_84743 [Lentinula lateritia]|nr:hypothetical protein EV368DRAFT_84743 [Lentinula lateritia]